MKSLARSQSHKIRTNAVLPGLLLTEWVGSRDPQGIAEANFFDQGQRFPAEAVKAYESQAALQRVVRCLETAEVV